MEKCPNCGGDVRPGAKFCTSCGTRLTDTPTPSSQASAEEPAAATESMAVATPTAEPARKTTDDPFASWGKPADESTGSSSPADRFEAGLEGAKTSPDSTSTSDASSTTYTASTWGTPAKADEQSDEDRFASWAAAYGSHQRPASETAAGSADTASEPTNTTHEPARSTEHDVVIEQPMQDSEARQRAASLIEELRSLVWQIGVTEKTDGDENMAKVALAGARGQSSDFSDIRRALDDVKASPRDLDVLAALSSKADRIQELLDSHTRLLGAIDEAIDELR